MSQKISTGLALVIVALVATFFGRLIWNVSQWSVVEDTVFVSSTKLADNVVSEKNVYENKEYGFSIELPSSWDGYEATVESADNLPGDKLITLCKWTKSDDNIYNQRICGPLLGILVFSRKNWDAGRMASYCRENQKIEDCPDKESLLGMNSKFVFTLQHPQAAPPEEIRALLPEFMRGNGFQYQNQDVDFFKKGFKTFDVVPTAGWKTYRNEQYGFEVKYPAEYRVMEDKSGWPHSVALISILNSQSYALPIEVWDSEAALKLGMQAGTRSTDMSQVTVKKLSSGKLITLLNQNNDAEVTQIIATFGFIEPNASMKTYRNERYGFEFQYPKAVGEFIVREEKSSDDTPITYINFSLPIDDPSWVKLKEYTDFSIWLHPGIYNSPNSCGSDKECAPGFIEKVVARDDRYTYVMSLQVQSRPEDADDKSGFSEAAESFHLISK